LKSCKILALWSKPSVAWWPLLYLAKFDVDRAGEFTDSIGAQSVDVSGPAGQQACGMSRWPEHAASPSPAGISG
jgi:hypothetical protein